MADTDRRDGTWVLLAQTEDGRRGVMCQIVWEANADEVAEEHSPLVFESIAAYSDFRAFWRSAGGLVRES